MQIHLRHLVGGRARSYMGALPDEQIFQVDFPERPGALRKFLDVFSPDFLITLFHYRKTGVTTFCMQRCSMQEMRMPHLHIIL